MTATVADPPSQPYHRITPSPDIDASSGAHPRAAAVANPGTEDDT
jgi:hypothetical protein